MLRCLCMFLPFFVTLLSFHNAIAQSVFSLQRPQGSLINAPTKGDVAFFYETTHPIKDQMGEWNFLLKERERASVNLLNEAGDYQEIMLYTEDDDVFSHLQFSYTENGQLQQIEEKNQLYGTVTLLNYTFDRRGRASSIRCTLNGAPLNEMVFTPKGRSRLSEKLVARQHNLQIFSEYQNGLPLQREVFDTSNALISKEIYTYNKQRLVSTTESTFTAANKGNSQSTFTYRYDDRGNWINMLEHNHATGIFTLVTRTIVYRDQLPLRQEQPVGHWNCPIDNLVLEVNEDGSFDLIDGQKREVLHGKWSNLGWGRFQFNVRYQDHFGSRRPFRSNQGMTMELREGRLMLYDKDHHFDFLAEEIRPSPEIIRTAQAHAIWEAALWESPGKRREDAIPSDIKAAFDNAYPVAPNKFRVCLDSLCGIINEMGAVLLPFAYEYITPAGQDLYVINKENKAGLIDQFGREILPAIYDRIWWEPKIGSAIFGTRKDGKRYYYDLKKGDFLPYEKDDIMSFNDDRMVVREGRYWVLTDRDFNPITEKDAYYVIKCLSADRYLASNLRRQYWILDADGNPISAILDYRNIRKTIFGYLEAETYDSNLYALLDHDGKQLTPPLYERLTFCSDEKEQAALFYELRNHNAIAKYRKPNGEEGFLTGLGEEVQSRK